MVRPAAATAGACARGACAPDGALRRRPPAAIGRRRSLGVVDRSGLPDDRDLDLPGVLELALDVARDPVRKQRGRVVVDLLGLDDHADLATGLHRVDLLHAFVLERDVLELTQSLRVVLERLAAGAG